MILAAGCAIKTNFPFYCLLLGSVMVMYEKSEIHREELLNLSTSGYQNKSLNLTGQDFKLTSSWKVYFQL